MWHVQDDISSRNFGLMRFIFASMTRFLTNSTIADGSTIKESFFLEDKLKCEVIFNGVPLEEFRMPESRKVFRSSLNFEEDDYIIGHVARIGAWKGQEYLLKAFIEYAIKHPDVSSQLVFIGSPLFMNDDYLHSLKNLAYDSGLSNRVHFLGFRSDLGFILSGLDVFIYPSRLDGIGLTLAEAISSGLPSITTNSPPMNEFVREGVSGKLVDVDHYLGRNDGYYWAQSICNVRSLQNAIQYFVNIDNQSLQKFKDSTRHFAEVNLDWKNNARDINNIFKQELIKHNDSKESLSSELIHTLRRLDRIFKPSILIEFSQFARSIFSYLKTKF